MTSRYGLFLLIILCLSLAASGCSVRAQQLKSQPLNITESVSNSEQTTAKFLLYPLEDLRGGEYGYLYPSSLIPAVNFFHIGSYNQYPEQAGILQSNQGGKATVTVGSLPSAFPYLLADLMRNMRLTPNATPIDQINTKVKLASFDYVIMGKLKNTKLTQHINMIPLALLGILGAPYIFVNGEMEFEISLYKGGKLDNPLLTKTYTFKDSMVVGLYYNHSAYFDLFIGALEKNLPIVVKDLALATAK